MLFEQLRHGGLGFNLAEVKADLFEPGLLLLSSGEEFPFLDFIILRKGLVGEPIRFVVAEPPLDLVLGLGLVAFHMALDLMNAANDLVGNLPEAREFVAVR
jgi:hypothetical protein